MISQEQTKEERTKLVNTVFQDMLAKFTGLSIAESQQIISALSNTIGMQKLTFQDDRQGNDTVSDDAPGE